MATFGTRLNGSVTEIRMFLKADSANGLVRLQLQNNIKFQSHFSYTDFTQSSVDKKWYCWYLIDIQILNTKKADTTRKETISGPT